MATTPTADGGTEETPTSPAPVRMTQEQLGEVIAEQVTQATAPLQASLEALQNGQPGSNPAFGQVAAAASGDPPNPQPAPAPAAPQRHSAEEVTWNLGVSPAVRNRAMITPVSYRADASTPPSEQLFAGQAMAQFVRATISSQRSILSGAGYKSPQQMATELYGEGHFVTTAIAAAVQNSVNSTSAGSGGILIPPGFTSDFIELLRPRTVFLAAGPAAIDNPTGNLPIPKQSSGANAGYITEGQAIPVSHAGFGQENAVSKIMGALTTISNVWLDRANAGADRLIVNDLVNAGSQKLDQVGLRSTGAGGEPKGMRYWAHPDNVRLADNPAPGDPAEVVLQKVENTYQMLWLALTSNNVSLTNPHVFMSSRSFSWLKGLRDGNGNLVYRDELNRGMWGEIPTSWSNQIPNDLGLGGNESEITLANMDDIVFADEKAVSVAVDDKAIQNGDTVQPLWAMNMTAIRLLMAHDIIARYSRAIAVAKGCTWGAVL